MSEEDNTKDVVGGTTEEEVVTDTGGTIINTASAAPRPPGTPEKPLVKKKRKKKSSIGHTAKHSSSSSIKPRKSKSNHRTNDSGEDGGSTPAPSARKTKQKLKSELPDQRKKKKDSKIIRDKDYDSAEEASVTNSTLESSAADSCSSSLHHQSTTPSATNNRKNESSANHQLPDKDRKTKKNKKKKKPSKSALSKQKTSHKSTSESSGMRGEEAVALTIRGAAVKESSANTALNQESSSSPEPVPTKPSWCPKTINHRSTSLATLQSESRHESHPLSSGTDSFSKPVSVSPQDNMHGSLSETDTIPPSSAATIHSTLPSVDGSTPAISTRKQRHSSPTRFRRFLEVFNDNRNGSTAAANTTIQSSSTPIHLQRVSPPAERVSSSSDSATTTTSSLRNTKSSSKSPRWSSPRRIRQLLQPIKANRRRPRPSPLTATEKGHVPVTDNTKNIHTTQQIRQPEKQGMVRTGSFSDMSDRTLLISNQRSATVEHPSEHVIEDRSGVIVASFEDKEDPPPTQESVPPAGPDCRSPKEQEFLPICTPKPCKVPSAKNREEFHEKLSFAFDLCRRRMTQQPSSEDEEFAFLPLMDMFLDEVNLKTFRKVARKNRDLELVKLQLYQLHFSEHSLFEALLDVLQKYFGSTVRHIVLNFSSMKQKDIAAITQRFVHLEELCLFGQLSDCSDDNDQGTNIFVPLMSQVKVLDLPHMNILPDGIYEGLSHPQCLVQNLTIKVDSQVERLVQALKTGQTVRRLRLETSTKSPWLPKMLAQYDKLESLEIYVNERDFSDRLSAWMI